MNKQEQNLMTEAAQEITSLRTVNHRMNLRMQMFDDCMLLLKAQLPSMGMGMSEDVVRKIEKAIEEQKFNEQEENRVGPPSLGLRK